MKLNELPYKYERVVIINVNTLLCTTLAILSAKRYVNMPLLVIDCPLNGKSDFANLQKLSADYNFELLQMPLQQHGTTLDELFTNLNSDFICLVDSDLEILSNKAINLMRDMMHRSMIEEERVFGSGMIQPFGFGLPPLEHYVHKERMWIPLTYLNRKLIKSEIDNGVSFNITSVANHKLKFLPKLRKAANRLNLSLIRKGVDWLMEIGRKQFKGRKIDIIHYDTGAFLYETMNNKGFHFIGWSFYAYPIFCTHYCGITRSQMYENEPVASQLDDLSAVIKSRLMNEYQFFYESYYD